MNTGIQQTKFDKANRMVSLLVDHATGKPVESSEYEVLRQELLSDIEVARLMPSFVRKNRNLSSFWSFIKPKFSTYAERRTYLSEEFTPLLDFLEFDAPPTSLANNSEAEVIGQTVVGSTVIFEGSLRSAARNKRKVFIVHGRDNEAKQEAARFIETIGLQSIILHEQASTGMTIIEKIESYSSEADFALVLYTPCDLARGGHEHKAPARSRARQNVVFEHGYLMAKYGRENVWATSLQVV
jgi:hypothetical protein